jgi:hypothetical protein
MWVLEPNAGLLLAGVVLFCTSLWLDVPTGEPRPAITARAYAAYGGVCTSMTILLFIIAAGNLWPIVLVLDYIIVGGYLGAGWGVGRLIARLGSVLI